MKNRPAVPVASASELVSRRPWPYPFRALLAICSDLDETPDRRVYLDEMRFLNTTGETPLGPGLGLEVGNSIYFDMPPDQFAYWTTDDAGREMVRSLIRSGHVDCLHSYGDLATTRAHAGRALDELSRHGCRLEVWVDHAIAPTNFGADIMRGSGDVPGSPAFHADLTCSFGVQFVWRGRVTSVIGQDVPRSLGGLFERRHPLVSSRTVAKEIAKGFLARSGYAKYMMHGANQALRPSRLRSGHVVYEFLRANPYWGGVERGETASGLAEVLTPRMLKRLEERGGVCLLYTHLGKVQGRREPFEAATRGALVRLAERVRSGSLFVTTTRRALRYCRAVRESAFTADVEGDVTHINLMCTPGQDGEAATVNELAGLSFYVPDPARTRVTLNGLEVARLQRNPADHTGRPSISVPWPALEFPRL